MAVTIVTSPGTLVAGLRPVTFTATSDREASTAVTGVTVGSDGGGSPKCRYSKAAIGSSYKVGDVITPSLFSSRFNVRQTVTAVDAGLAYIDTDLAWVTDADLSGTVTRTNDDFKLKVEVSINGSYTDSAVYRYSQNGTFTINIEKFLQSYLNYKIMAVQQTTAIQGTLPNNMITFIIKCNEYWNNAANVSTLTPTVADRDAVSSAKCSAIMASRQHDEISGIATNYILADNTKLFLTKAPRLNAAGTNIKDLPVIPLVKGDCFLSFFFDTAHSLKLGWITSTQSGTPIATGYGANFTMTDKYATLPVNFNWITAPAAGSLLAVWVYDNTAAAAVSEAFTFLVIDDTKEPTHIPVTFLNSFGAWDTFSFYYDYEDTVETQQNSFEKVLGMSWATTDAGVETFYTKQKRRLKIKSKLVSTTVARWLEELQRSKKVLMHDGTNRFPLTNVKVTIPNIKKNDYLIQVTLEADYPDVH